MKGFSDEYAGMCAMCMQACVRCDCRHVCNAMQACVRCVCR